MLNIYNKILKEALDIMDFDSWDDSEQTFKDNINITLSSPVFTYHCACFGKEAYIQIFEKVSVWIWKWAGWENGFKDTEAYVDGISYPLTDAKTIIIDNPLIISNINKNKFLTKVVLKFPKQLEGNDCINMFANSDIVKVPSLNVSKCTSLKYMFVACKYLETVEPFIGLDNITDAWGMFAYGSEFCPYLDKKTISYWKPANSENALERYCAYSNGTPERWNSPEFFHET